MDRSHWPFLTLILAPLVCQSTYSTKACLGFCKPSKLYIIHLYVWQFAVFGLVCLTLCRWKMRSLCLEVGAALSCFFVMLLKPESQWLELFFWGGATWRVMPRSDSTSQQGKDIKNHSVDFCFHMNGMRNAFAWGCKP